MTMDFTNIGNFNYQISNVPKVSKKEELVTKMFPGFTDKQVKQLYKDTALVPAEKRQEVQQQMYRAILPKLKERDKQEQRTIQKNALYNDVLDEKDTQKVKIKQSAIRVADLADEVRKTVGPIKENDDEIVKKVIDNTPNGRMLFQKYINDGDEEFLYQAGIKERPKPIEGKNPLLRAGEGLIGGVVGAVEGAIEGVTDGFTSMVKDSKRILADKKKSAPEKFNQILFGEFGADYIGGTIGKTFGGALEGLYEGFTTESERKAVDKSVKGVMESIVQTEPVQNIMKKYNQLEPDQQQELNDLMGYAMNATEFAGVGLGAKPIKAGAKAVGEVAKEGLEQTAKISGKIVKGVSDINPTESAAKYITKTATPQDKLFKAQNPSINQLNRNVNLKTKRQQSDIANELIVKEGYKPVDTETRRIAHEKTMQSTWKKIESQIGDRKTYQVDQRKLAFELEQFIKEQKELGVTETMSDILALEKQAKELRKQRFVDLPTLEKKKQVINGIVNNWGDSKVGDVYKNGMKKLTQAIGKEEDAIISKIPGEFAESKKLFGALKSTYEDVLKADIKNQKRKGMDIIESYSRIEGIGDIVGGALSIISKGGAGLVDVGKGLGKVFIGKSLKKATDPDFLIKEGFENLFKTK